MSRNSRRVMRLSEWSLPPRAEHLELLEVQPASDAAGDGRPPLLFLHGLGHAAWCYAEHWLPAAAAQGWPSYAMSYRGHGGSGGHTRLRRSLLRSYVHDVLQVVASLPSPPVIVGHSLGSLVAQRVLARYPARAGVLLTPLPASGLRHSVVPLLRRKPLAVAKAMGGATLRFGPEDLFAGLDPATAADYTSRVGRESPWAQYPMLLPERRDPISCPMLVVGAEGDALIAPEDVQRCASELDAELIWVPGGHDVMLDSAWRDVLDTVLGWIDGVTPAGSPALPGASAAPLARVLT